MRSRRAWTSSEIRLCNISFASRCLVVVVFNGCSHVCSRSVIAPDITTMFPVFARPDLSGTERYPPPRNSVDLQPLSSSLFHRGIVVIVFPRRAIIALSAGCRRIAPSEGALSEAARTGWKRGLESERRQGDVPQGGRHSDPKRARGGEAEDSLLGGGGGDRSAPSHVALAMGMHARGGASMLIHSACYGLRRQGQVEGGPAVQSKHWRHACALPDMSRQE